MLDLQINGYAGVDFNGDDLTLDALEYACDRLRDDGVTGILATIITDELDRMCGRLRQLVALRQQSRAVENLLVGIHIEGPFFPDQAGYIGAHPPLAACPAELHKAEELLDAAGGLTRIFTLAPERDPSGRVTQFLDREGVIVSAGHCNPSLEQLRRSLDYGLKSFTHLGNGCPMHVDRHDNIIQRVLSLSEHLKIGFIADGAHIPLFALQNYLKCAGLENCYIVSDTISAAGQGVGEFHIGDQTVYVGEDLVPWAADRSHLVGSACPLKVMYGHLENLGFEEDDLRRLFVENPANLIGHSPAIT